MYKKREFIILSMVTVIYLFFAFAWQKKDLINPATEKCTLQAFEILYKHDSIFGFRTPYVNSDTMYVFASKDSGWVNTAQQVCKIYKDSCTITKLYFAVINNRAAQNTWNHPQGKLIYSTTCP